MTEISDALLAQLTAADGAWVSCTDLARALYELDETSCNAAVAARVRKRIEILRGELPDGVRIETGFRLGYKLSDARAAA